MIGLKDKLELGPKGEIGGRDVKFVTHFLNKDLYHVQLFICIDRKSKYHIIRRDNKTVFKPYSKKFKSLPKAVEYMMANMVRKECRIKHPPKTGV